MKKLLFIVLVFSALTVFGDERGGIQLVRPLRPTRLTDTPAPVPEPATLFMLATGLAIVAARIRRQRAQM